jgi:hypothetical protein
MGDDEMNSATPCAGQAASSEGADRARLLGEAVAAYRSALEVRTREALPQDRATTQNNLGAALRGQAFRASAGADRRRLLGGAVRRRLPRGARSPNPRSPAPTAGDHDPKQPR